MKLTQPEKLIISMLAQLHEKLEIEPETAKLISSAIYSDNTWALSWELSGIVGDDREENPPVVDEVTRILTMWRFIENGLHELSPEDRAEVERAAGGDVKFPGFDGNDEGEHYSVARFLVKEMGRFDELKDHELNSHHNTLHRARAMLDVYKPHLDKMYRGQLSKQQLIEILTAG